MTQIEKRLAKPEAKPRRAAPAPPIAPTNASGLDELAARVYRLEAAPVTVELLERRLAELERKIRHLAELAETAMSARTGQNAVAMVKNGLCEAAEAEPAALSLTSSPTEPAPGLENRWHVAGAELRTAPAVPRLTLGTEGGWPHPGKPVEIGTRHYPSRRAFFEDVAARYGLPRTLPATWHRAGIAFEAIEARAADEARVIAARPPGPRPGRPPGSPNLPIGDPRRKVRLPPLLDADGNVIKRPRGRPLGWRKPVAAIDPAA
jgi:hypothetical protein